MPSNKPPAVQAAVIAKSMNGDSKSQIAQDLSIARNTVTRILEDAELSELARAGKTSLYELIPKSIKAFEHALDKHKTAEATIVLRATGVLPQEQSEAGMSVNVNLGAIPRPNHV